MIYQIYYIPKGEQNNIRGYTLFDIDYYQKQSNNSKDWFSEIHCLPKDEWVFLPLYIKKVVEDNFHNLFV